MHRYPILLSIAVCAGAIFLTSCSSSSGKARYPTAHASIAHKVEKGQVMSVREVIIDGQATNMGMILGAGVGGAVGGAAAPRRDTIQVHQDGSISSSSNAAQNAVAIAVGSVVGAVAARHIERQLTSKKAQELMIQLESGETVIVVQEERDPPFIEGEVVQVYTTRTGSSRVFHSEEDPFLDPDTSAYLIGDEATEEKPEFEPVTW